ISHGGRIAAISRAVKENPAVSVPAVGAGSTLGAGIGSLVMPGYGTAAGGALGAVGAMKLVERMAASKAMRKLGGIPEDVNPLAAASKVKPVGDGATPTAQQRAMSPKPAPIPTVNEEEVVSALTNQGYPRKTARTMAQAAIQDNPHDFDAALRQALAGKSVSGAKASAIEDASEEARRGGPGPPPKPEQDVTTRSQVAQRVTEAKARKPKDKK